MQNSVPFSLHSANPMECVSLHTVDGTYLYVSDASQTVMGLTPEELQGRSFYDLVYPADAARLATLIQVCAREGAESHRCLVRFRSQKGQYTWLDVVAQPILDSAQRVIQFGVRASLFSVTGPSSEFSPPLDTAPDRLVWNAIVDDIGVEHLCWQLHLNEAEASRFLPIQVEPEQSLAYAWWMSRPEEDRIRCDALANHKIRAGHDYYHEFRCRMQDGSLRWFAEDASVKRINDSSWSVTGVVTDITRFKTPDSEYHGDSDFVVWNSTVWKDPFGKLHWDFVLPETAVVQRFLPLKVPPDSTYLITWARSIHPEDRQRKHEYGTIQVLAGRSYSQRFRCQRADGAFRWIHEYVHVETIGPDKWKLVGFWSDVTHRKHHDDTLQYMLSGAQCLIWYADVEVTQSGRLNRRACVLDEEVARRFLLIDVPPGNTYVDAWYRSRVDEDRDHTDAYCFNEMRAGRSYHQEYSCRCANGDIRWISECVNVETVDTNRWKLVGVCTDITKRRQAELQVQKQNSRLVALNFINSMIAACLDLHHTLRLVLEQVIQLLAVDAADILRYNPHTHMLEYEVGQGFRGPAWSEAALRIGEGLAGRAALDRNSLWFPDGLYADGPCMFAFRPFAEEGVIAYAAIPMIARGQLVGVVELFHRSPLKMELEWRVFVETVACQSAIAIDNAALFENLQETNANLSQAYDATIEGWSRILDMRDKETEGHSQRVTALTLRLARALDIPDTELLPMRYGALLHDIGKMGIPDSILLKPAVLNTEEWEIMRKHPEYAYDMLRPIEFLRPALHIPYCHHEKWDGSGYPRGLKGTEIPLAARIFAVVDVWDALCHPRPYRPALPPEAVREHIRRLAGTHMDPAIVAVFLSMEW